MKYLGKMLVGILVLLLVIPATSSSAEDEQWKLEISLEKDTFLMREPVWLDVVVTNISEDTLRARGLYPPCQGSWLCIEITDSVGNLVPYSGPLHDIYWGDGIPMFPKEIMYNCFNLLDLYGARYTSTYNFPALTPGRYFVQGEYLESPSNKISFLVVELMGKEKEEEKSIIDAYKKDTWTSAGVAQPALRKILKSYPNSVFTEIIALSFLGSSDYLNKFPNSGNTRSSLLGCMQGLTDEEKIEYLENAIIKYKGTRAARHAEQLLRRQRK